MLDVSASEDRILRHLKFRGPQPTEAVARHLSVSLPGGRKHLDALRRRGLVDCEDVASGVGRPKRLWRLTEKAQERFPDSHAVLTLEMIRSVRTVFGAAGLDRLIAERESETGTRYRAAMEGAAGIADRIARLAALRSEEGYMAEWSAAEDGSFLLVENHCPICAAATLCQGFCRSELALFRATLGADHEVTREEHIVAGARRCAYRITPREKAA